ADQAEELADVPPLSRLRVALEARRHDHMRELIPLLDDQTDAMAALLIELAPRLDAAALRLLLPACEHVVDAASDTVLFRLLACGPAAADAIRLSLERAASVGGR